jgi:hypothetical protein
MTVSFMRIHGADEKHHDIAERSILPAEPDETALKARTQRPSTALPTLPRATGVLRAGLHTSGTEGGRA